MKFGPIQVRMLTEADAERFVIEHGLAEKVEEFRRRGHGKNPDREGQSHVVATSCSPALCCLLDHSFEAATPERLEGHEWVVYHITGITGDIELRMAAFYIRALEQAIAHGSLAVENLGGWRLPERKGGPRS